MIDWSNSVLVDASGRMEFMVAVGVDVTMRNKAQRAVVEKEAQLQAIVNSVSDGILITDVETHRFTFGNQAICRMLGATADELLTMGMESIQPTESFADIQHLVAAMAQRETRFAAHVPLLRSDGGVVSTDFSGTALMINGRHSYVGIFRDITERKKSEAREAAHLRKLEELAKFSMMLSGDPSAVFERVLGLIGALFDVPVVCLAEIVGPQLKFLAVYAKGQIFLEPGGCPLNITPCSMVEHDKDIRIIERVQERFPEATFLRDHEAYSYLGIPALDHAGQVVAVICLLDDKPHAFSAEDQSLLRVFGQRIAAEMERAKITAARKQAEQELRASRKRLQEAQRIAQIGNWELELQSGHLFWSEEIYRIFEIDPAEFSASYEAFLDTIHPEDRERVNTAYTHSLRDRQSYRIIHRLRMKDGRIKFVEEQCETDFAADGAPLCSRGTVQDVTAAVLADETLRRSLHEKETLLREIHHRVKNNLQIISSLLYFQEKKIRNEQDALVLTDARLRLRSMILVHEKLYQSSDLSLINFADYLQSLVAELHRSHGPQAKTISLRIDADPILAPIDVALPCGMIICELLINVFKYAFAPNQTGTVIVSAKMHGDRLSLSVADNGAGLPTGFDAKTSDTFGWQLINNLVVQLDGTVSFGSKPGTCVTVSVPFLIYAD